MNISIDHNREKKIISNEVQKINDRNGLLRLWNWDLLTVHEEMALDGAKDQRREGSMGKVRGKR